MSDTKPTAPTHSEHIAKVSWKKNKPDFVYETYDRTHEVTFPGGQKIKNSAAPAFMGNASYTNPEELLAASLSTCHMLTFLAVSAKSRLVIESYEDTATAILEKNEKGKMAVTKIVLQPRIVWGGEKPSPEKIKEIHDKAHANCMIANSILSHVVIE